MPVVYDRHVEEMKPLRDLLTANKMNFAQFIRTVNFVRNITQEQLNAYIDAYEKGEFNDNGWY